MSYINKTVSRFSIRSALISAMVASSLISSTSFADDKVSISSRTAAEEKIGMVDIQAAIVNTNEGKAAKARIEKEAEAKRKEILGLQNELKKIETDFQAQQNILTPAEKTKKQEEFQGKFQRLQQMQMQFEQEFRQKEMQATQKIYANLIETIGKMAKQKGYDKVFDRNGTLLYAAKYDEFTSDLIKEYNSHFNDKPSAASGKQEKSKK